MKIKCDCGSETFVIEERKTCKGCENNPCVGCFVCCPENNEWKECENEGMAECDSFLSSSSENGECDMGTNHDNGCIITSCSVCSKILRFIPYAEE